jgi:hypothetical protein
MPSRMPILRIGIRHSSASNDRCCVRVLEKRSCFPFG